MRRVAVAAGAALLLWPALYAQEKTKDTPSTDKPKTPAEQYQDLQKEFQSIQQKLIKDLQDAKTPEERQKVLANRPKPGEFTNKFLDLAKKHPKEPFAVDALTFVMMRAANPAQRNKVVELLATEYSESEKIAPICRMLPHYSKQGEKHLRNILKKNPHREVQAQAAFALAGSLKDQSEKVESKQPDKAKDKVAEEPKKVAEAAGIKAALEAKKKAAADEAEKLFELIIQKYGDVRQGRKTMADYAKGELFELRNLAIGKVAPEIEGEDIDGKPFKLTDYRGKVVALDFWGHW